MLISIRINNYIYQPSLCPNCWSTTGLCIGYMSICLSVCLSTFTSISIWP